ncbi:carbon-nitrogen hydrolase [Planctomycetota bacterium]|nr:carbon-nitrogen hydrolase [Planctomycetota bacterium]
MKTVDESVNGTDGNLVRVALLQYAVPIGSRPEAVLNKTEVMIREAVESGADVVVTPELFMSPYFCREQDPKYFDLAEELPGETTKRLQKLASELGITIHASLFEKRAMGLYHNTSVTLVAEGGDELMLYRKMHIPHDPSFEEKYYFTPGDGFVLHETSNLKIGPLICWDQWFPEAARIVSLMGAELLVYPTAIAYLDGESEDEQKAQREAWVTMLRSHAIANNVYVAACNRVGREGELDFWGTSIVVGPNGVVMAEGSEDKDEIVMAELDLGRIEEQRRWWPYMRDRRIDEYQTLLKRFADGT